MDIKRIARFPVVIATAYDSDRNDPSFGGDGYCLKNLALMHSNKK